MVYVIRDFVDSFVVSLSAATPVPAPVEVPEQIDPNRVSPGMLGLIVIIVLGIAAALIYYFLRGSLNKINYDEDATIDQSKPLDEYLPKDDSY